MLKESEVEKLRIREVEQLAQGHTAREQKSGDSEPGLCPICLCPPYPAQAQRGVGCGILCREGRVAAFLLAPSLPSPKVHLFPAGSSALVRPEKALVGPACPVGSIQEAPSSLTLCGMHTHAHTHIYTHTCTCTEPGCHFPLEAGSDGRWVSHDSCPFSNSVAEGSPAVPGKDRERTSPTGGTRSQD